MKCRLCQSDKCLSFAKDTIREYVRCENCSLIFVPDNYFLTPTEEKARYALHDNTIDNNGYVTYLTGFADELKQIPIADPKILDFGCGEAAVLTSVLTDKGIDCKAYDPLYDIGNASLNTTYDIIIICEVIEHLKDISKETRLLKKLLSKTGYILMKTELLQNIENFTDWWYTKDPTHINFFSTSSIKVFADLMDKKLTFTNIQNVMILG